METRILPADSHEVNLILHPPANFASGLTWPEWAHTLAVPPMTAASPFSTIAEAKGVPTQSGRPFIAESLFPLLAEEVKCTA
jgi:hypothetical protein